MINLLEIPQHTHLKSCSLIFMNNQCALLCSDMPGKICVIGAGPSGMAVLWWYAKRAQEGKEVPEIVCYEKQGDWGGLWNYSWRTGTDQHGEAVHGSMYRLVIFHHNGRC